MNRLQKKCFVATISFHLLLLVILLVGPGFFTTKPKVDESPDTRSPITIVLDPAMSADKPVANPSAPLLLNKPAVVPVASVPAQPLMQNTSAASGKSASAPRIKPNIDLVVRTDSLASGKNLSSTSTPDSSGDERGRRAVAIKTVVRYLKDNLTTGTDVEMPASGGLFDSNYAAAVKDKYASAWNPPDDTASDDANTKVTVTISRDGTVISSRILNPSGDSRVDNSVRRTLDRVTFVAPFPDGAKEKERTFIINFNLKTKRLLG